jgi:hypothetical protein
VAGGGDERRESPEGFRGKSLLDIDAISEIIATVSEVMATGFIRVIDLNPVAIYSAGAPVTDARLRSL